MANPLSAINGEIGKMAKKKPKKRGGNDGDVKTSMPRNRYEW